MHGGTDADIIERCPTCNGGGRHVRECEIHERCTLDPVNPKVMNCKKCRAEGLGYEPVVPLKLKPTVPKTINAGIAIGSYKWPKLIELQIRLIKDVCGDVPILVSSDHPESNKELSELCLNYDNITLWPNKDRIGHTGGDISVFYKSIIWGAEKGLDVVAKLSQRFMVTKTNWLLEEAKNLLISGLPLASQRCTGISRFDLRTEFCLLDVHQWNKPEILDRIRPRAYWTDVSTGICAETIIYRVLQDHLGGIYHPLALIGEERYKEREGILWHNANSLSTYKALAQKYNIALPSDFTCKGWEAELAKGQYKYG
jgi:hypothetical protein